MSSPGAGERSIVDRADDCPFCDLPENPQSAFDATSLINVEGDIFLKPDLGMLIPGHLLAVTRDHLTSFAQLPRDRLNELDVRLNLYQAGLTERFGSYFRVEHGSDNIDGHGSGACIEHAHTHLIPADEDVGPYIQEQLPWQKLDAYEDLTEFRGAPYIYLGRLATHYVVPDPQLSGQWARRQVAAVRGLEQWDWALAEATNQLQATNEGLRDFPLRIFVGNGDG